MFVEGGMTIKTIAGIAAAILALMFARAGFAVEDLSRGRKQRHA